MAETRSRIITAGAELLHGFPVWNWKALTHRAVAEQAGVTERTVYRYFGSERELRDAVMGQMQAEAGVALDDLDLDDVKDAAARIFEYVAKFPIEPRTPRDPTVAEANERQRAALQGAVRREAKGWRPKDHTIAAAVLDVLWAPVAFERLVTDWELEPADATRAITWAMGLVQRALEEGLKPR